MLKKCFLVCLCLMLCLPAGLAEEWQKIPDVLRFECITGQKEMLTGNTYIRRTLPITALSSVDEELAALAEAFAADKALWPGKCQNSGFLDVTCRISRSGQSMMSFLVLASRVEDRLLTGLSFENRVYDMQTGRRITLSHLFPEESPAWALMESRIRSSLSACFPGMEADAAALDAICRKEALVDAAFSLTPVQLEMHFPAENLYPGKTALMHVRIPYRELRPYMNEYALSQTDNNAYKLTALTFDDGPIRNTTNLVLDLLLAHGANATFFLVGNRLAAHTDLVLREHNHGFSLASHNWEHEYKVNDNEKILKWKARFDETLSSICGVTPGLMRAPGGYHKTFTNAKVGLPLIQWSVNSSDGNGGGAERVSPIISNVINNTEPGAISLMHDMNSYSPQYLKQILKKLEDNNYFCVTVEDLFIHYGVEAEPNQAYFSLEGLPVPPISEGSNAL